MLKSARTSAVIFAIILAALSGAVLTLSNLYSWSFAVSDMVQVCLVALSDGLGMGQELWQASGTIGGKCHDSHKGLNHVQLDPERLY
jgi:hypothetical protein